MWIECVPNFSEGRRREVVEEIRRAIEAGGTVRVLDLEMDADHNRCVLTMVGEDPSAAAFEGARAAVRLIDLNRHTGEHPRMGAIDVLPFVPLAGATMDDCIRLARETGRRIGDELGVPVFLYERAAARPERRNLAEIRNKKSQFEQLREWIGTDPKYDPDFGPRRIHPTAGCVAVGARPFLVAYNVNLETPDLAVAKKIASRIRERDGGLPGVKALGLFMSQLGRAQVSMNLCDLDRTSVSQAFQAVRERAAELGIGVHSSEIVGLVPRFALPPDLAPLRLIHWDPARQIIENRLAATSGEAPR